jgi:hypothetical protein
MLTVLEAGDRWLTTIAMAIDVAGVPATTPEDEVARLVGLASSAVSRHCNRVFGRERLREAVRPGAGQLILSRRPVFQLHSVTGDGNLVELDGVELDGEAGLLGRLDAAGDACAWWNRRVIVEYSAGWAMPGTPGRDLPEDIEQACLLMIADAVAGEGRDPRLRSESTEGVGSTSWLDPRPGQEQLPPQAAGLLRPYRRIAI